MPVYEYVAIDDGGKRRKGSLDADSIRLARQRLRSQGVFPTEIKESNSENKEKSRDVKKYFASNSVSGRDLAVATRQLSTLVGAGLPLVSSLSALADQTESKVLQRIIVDVREKVEEGSSLAKALGNYPKSFSRLYVNLVNSAEASGTLDTVLANLADYLESQLELKRKVTTALFYPILMLILSVSVIVALFVFVIPKVVEIFKKQGAELPLPTQITLAISNFLVGYWYILLALLALSLLSVRWYYKRPEGQERIDRIFLKLPIYGRIYTKICTARVAQTLSTMLSSGVGLLTALDITKNIAGNIHVIRAIENAREGVREGRSLAGEFAKSGLFPNMLCHMIAVGETSGQLESMLGRAGKAYENEVNATLAGLTSLLEPIMMVVVGMVVLAIVISVLMPMTDLIDVLQPK